MLRCGESNSEDDPVKNINCEQQMHKETDNVVIIEVRLQALMKRNYCRRYLVSETMYIEESGIIMGYT